MKKATPTQLKLRAYICNTYDPQFAISIIEDVEEFHKEITEPEQIDALIQWETYFEIYKDVHGISPRWTSYKDMTAEQWEKKNQKLQEEVIANLA